MAGPTISQVRDAFTDLEDVCAAAGVIRPADGERLKLVEGGAGKPFLVQLVVGSEEVPVDRDLPFKDNLGMTKALAYGTIEALTQGLRLGLPQPTENGAEIAPDPLEPAFVEYEPLPDGIEPSTGDLDDPRHDPEAEAPAVLAPVPEPAAPPAAVDLASMFGLKEPTGLGQVADEFLTHTPNPDEWGNTPTTVSEMQDRYETEIAKLREQLAEQSQANRDLEEIITQRTKDADDATQMYLEAKDEITALEAAVANLLELSEKTRDIDDDRTPALTIEKIVKILERPDWEPKMLDEIGLLLIEDGWALVQQGYFRGRK